MRWCCPTWRDRLAVNPFGTAAGIAAIILGVLGAVIGDRVSQGMTNSLASASNGTAHVWGALLAAGGVFKLSGLYSGRSSVEISGLWLMAGGYLFYAITVLAGLGSHGLAAGIISSALATGCAVKVRVIMRRARDVTRIQALTHDAGDGAGEDAEDGRGGGPGPAERQGGA